MGAFLRACPSLPRPPQAVACAHPPAFPALAASTTCTPPLSNSQSQVDAEYDVSGKASEAARKAAEAARKVNEAAEDADSKFHFRRKAQILWSDLKRNAPLVRLAAAGWLAGVGAWTGMQAGMRAMLCQLPLAWSCPANHPCIADWPPPHPTRPEQWGQRMRDFFETPLGAVTFFFLFLVSGGCGCGCWGPAGSRGE